MRMCTLECMEDKHSRLIVWERHNVVPTGITSTTSYTLRRTGRNLYEGSTRELGADYDSRRNMRMACAAETSTQAVTQSQIHEKDASERKVYLALHTPKASQHPPSSGFPIQIIQT
jgi:hypothetical protein